MKKWIACSLIVLVLIGLLWLWFAPSGTGEYADSPDKRYRAFASNMSRGTWFHGREEYILVDIVDSTTGREVWRAERFPLPGETPPEYGDRSKKFIKWSADSKSVSIPVGGAADSVWVVP